MKKLLLIAALAFSSVAAFAETYTLSIGINDYPVAIDEETGEEQNFDLFGCVNDAKAMKAVYMEKFGVKEANTRLLLDKEATGEKLLDSIKWLLSKAKTGDQIVFSFSGHGGQIEDPQAADGSGKTEVIVLADDTLVQDALFNEIANMFRINGVNATFIFDSCHSGGMSRDTGKLRVKDRSMGLIKPKARMMANMAKVITGVMEVKSRQAAGTKLGETLFLFASEKDKTSKDISGLEGIPAHGLFTMLLLDFMDANKSVSVTDLYKGIDATLKEVNAAIKENALKEGVEEKDIPVFDQGPNFEGTATRAAKPIILAN